MLAHDLAESRASQGISLPPHHIYLARIHLPSWQTGLTRLMRPSTIVAFPSWPANTQEAPHSCRASHPELLTLGKSSMAQEHQGKPCPAMGNVPTLHCTPANITSPWEALLSLGKIQLGPPTLGKCCTPAEKASQHHPPLGRVPCPRNASTSPAQL